MFGCLGCARIAVEARVTGGQSVTMPVIAIAGSTGQVALALMRQATGRKVRALCAGRPQLDLADAASIEAFLDDARPNIVINAAAYTAVDKAEGEPQLARTVNAEGPATLACGCAKLNIPLIQISTDYVFDGTKTSPYLEDDAIAPLSVYGRTKADGEEAVRHLSPKHLIVRTSWVYGPDGANFLKTMLRLAAERDEVGVVGDQHGAPTRADDLAAALLDVSETLINSTNETRWGTYHLAGGGQTTWHGFASKIFEHAAAKGLKIPRLRQIATQEYPTPARRPAYSVLDQAKIGKSFGVRMPDWSDSLARHFANLP